MLTNAWYRAIGVQIAGRNPNRYTYRTPTNYERPHAAITIFSHDPEIWNGLTFGYIKTVSGSYSSPGVVFGNGTEATEGDYKLSGDIVTGYTWSSSYGAIDDEDGFLARAVYTITNNNADDITISEIGYIGTVPYDYRNGDRALLDHTILENPVTIPAGGVGQVTYTIRMDYPTA